MKKVRVYSDGACSGNPGPGGWGAIMQCDNPPAEKELSGAEADSTNNRMELMAVIGSLEALRESCEVTIYTDSSYVADAFKKNWIAGWLRNGWKTAAKTPVKNSELWQRLLAAVKPHKIEWVWIRGHNGHPENERADRLAVAARERIASGRRG